MSLTTRKRYASGPAVLDSTPKRKKYSCKYNKDWSSEFTWVSSSYKGPDFANCTVCLLHFSVIHGGKNDVKKHAGTVSHKKCELTTETSNRLDSFVGSNGLDDQVTTKAETLFSFFCSRAQFGLFSCRSFF